MPIFSSTSMSTYNYIMSTTKRMMMPCSFLHIIFLYFLLDTTLLQISLGNQCKLDFHQYEKRRIAAIKGQILSKLGMTAPPPDEGPTDVPRDVIELFNDTVRLLEQKYIQQNAACQAAQSEDFFAKVPILYHTQADWTGPDRDQQYYRQRARISRFYRFDLSNYRSDAGSDELTEAEIKLRQVPNHRKNAEQRFSLYQLIPTQQNAPRRKHLYSKSVNTQSTKWITFDVTETVRGWINVPGSNLGFELSLDCQDLNDPDQDRLHVMFANPNGNVPTVPNGRGDNNDMADHYMRDQYPRLVIMSVGDNQANEVTNAQNRRRRATGMSTTSATPTDNLCRDGNEPNCCLRELYVNFRKDLKWNWIRQPKGYYPNYCAGSCPYVWGADTQHSSLLHIYKALNPDASPSPCCSPKSFKPLNVLYYENGSPKIRVLSNMIVAGCKCS